MKEAKDIYGKYFTYHEGANDERTVVLAKVRRMIKDPKQPCGTTLEEIKSWLLQRNERYRKNPGGL